MSKVIIATVGTSLINNNIYDKHKYSSAVTLMQNGKPLGNKYNQIVESSAEILMQAVNENLKGNCLSAEMTSLTAFKNGKDLGLDTKMDLIVLLATETVDGIFCADVHKMVLDKLKWCRVEGPIKIDGINTKSAKSFQEAGLNNLKQAIDKILNGNTWSDKYFNITGGYKGIIPFATIHAFDRGMKLIYLYEEEGSELMIIEKEPGKGTESITGTSIKIKVESFRVGGLQ
jgi:putative CRISPR-associated protein (TIGR02619 family)